MAPWVLWNAPELFQNVLKVLWSVLEELQNVPLAIGTSLEIKGGQIEDQVNVDGAPWGVQPAVDEEQAEENLDVKDADVMDAVDDLESWKDLSEDDCQ